MPKILEVILLIVVPVVWGMSIHCVFELFRRRRARRAGPEKIAPAEVDAQ
jgi:hypothetical protein